MKHRTTEFKWAIIFFVMMLLWMVLERVAGLHDAHIDQHMIYTNFVAIPAIAVYVFALLDKRKRDLGGAMTYGQGFVSGLIITAIVTLLSPLLQYLTSEVISPQYFTNAAAHAVRTGMMTEQAAAEYFSLGNYLVQVLIGTPVMGLVTTAIVAIFTRRKA